MWRRWGGGPCPSRGTVRARWCATYPDPPTPPLPGGCASFDGQIFAHVNGAPFPSQRSCVFAEAQGSLDYRVPQAVHSCGQGATAIQRRLCDAARLPILVGRAVYNAVAVLVRGCSKVCHSPDD